MPMLKWKSALTALLLSSVAAAAPLDNKVQGAWVSPDWFLPGTRNYSEAEVRKRSRQLIQSLADSGFNTIFLETFLRGYSIAPYIENGRVTDKIPVYPHLRWNFQSDGSKVYDTLQIFVDEAQAEGIEVHAWTHMFYWKMDNPGANLAWHAAPSLWSRMTSEYLLNQAEALSKRSEVAPETVALLRETGQLLRRTTESREIEALLARHHQPQNGHPLGTVLRTAMRAGAPQPDFLLMGEPEDPFPAPRGKQLRPIYLNPGSARVREVLTSSVSNIMQSHPGLAGIHLDHIRYPVDGQGLPPELEVQDGTYNYYSQTNSDDLRRYQAIHQQLEARRENLRLLVEGIRPAIGRHRKLSAAVLPTYYRERDNGRYRLGGYDFSSQDWVTWKVDFVVPMLYELNPYFIRSLLTLFEAEQLKQSASNRIQVYPGVSQVRTAKIGLSELAGWVFFDLSMSRDVKLEKEKVEDFNFGAQ